jgi:nicotinamide riboside kinase
MKKVVIIGPECCGKTTLTHELAKYFNAPFVEE